jgi:hypothetical protein
LEDKGGLDVSFFLRSLGRSWNSLLFTCRCTRGCDVTLSGTIFTSIKFYEIHGVGDVLPGTSLICNSEVISLRLCVLFLSLMRRMTMQCLQIGYESHFANISNSHLVLGYRILTYVVERAYLH